MILRLLMFLGNDVATNISQQAITSLANINKNTLIAIQYDLEKYHFDFNYSIGGPVIIVPINKSNIQSSPIWVFNLGDFKIKTEEANKENEQYLRLSILLSKVNVEVNFFNINNSFTNPTSHMHKEMKKEWIIL